MADANATTTAPAAAEKHHHHHGMHVPHVVSDTLHSIVHGGAQTEAAFGAPGPKGELPLPSSHPRNGDKHEEVNAVPPTEEHPVGTVKQDHPVQHVVEKA